MSAILKLTQEDIDNKCIIRALEAFFTTFEVPSTSDADGIFEARVTKDGMDLPEDTDIPVIVRPIKSEVLGTQAVIEHYIVVNVNNVYVGDGRNYSKPRPIDPNNPLRKVITKG